MLFLYILVVGTVYILLGAYVAYRLGRIPRKGSRKALVASLVVLIFILIPTWDVLLGRWYFRHLCETEAGIKVYRQVELPAEYWDAEGRPRFIKENGDVDKEMLKDWLDFDLRQRQLSDTFRIQALDFIVIDKSSQKPIGQYTSLGYFGGWFVNSTGLHVSGTSCPDPNRRPAFSEAVLLSAVMPNVTQGDRE